MERYFTKKELKQVEAELLPTAKDKSQKMIQLNAGKTERASDEK